MGDLIRCMDRLGYRFRDESLLCRALTHSSLAVEQHRMGEDNERLEYLGDAVLEHLVSRHLFDTHPEMREGALTRLRSSLVFESALSAVAQSASSPTARRAVTLRPQSRVRFLAFVILRSPCRTGLRYDTTSFRPLQAECGVLLITATRQHENAI